MLGFLQKRWFLVLLVALIAAGLTAGSCGPVGPAHAFCGSVNPRWITAIVLFLMTFSLDSRQLRASFRTPGPVVWASALNYVFIPLLAWSLMAVQQTEDFAYGLMIACCVPCTLAAASVWTRKAHGNDAVSLLVTLVTNTVCFLVTPFWLNATTGRNVVLDTGYMIVRLLQAVLLPSLVGQSLRLWPAARRLATRFKTPIGVVAQLCILLLVFGAACDAGTHLGSDARTPGWGAVVLVWGTCIGIHTVTLMAGLFGARLLGFRVEDQAAIAFSCSQKTLPIGVLLATDPGMFGGGDYPFVVFPMIMYHASQLFIDTLVADRLAAKAALTR